VSATATSAALVDAVGDLWARLPAHPFVVAAADGTLSTEAFDRWIVQDHFFVVGFRRFVGRLVELAPTDAAREVVAGTLPALSAELALFRREAARRGLDLDQEPGPTTLGYTSYLLAAPADGWEVAVTVLYGAERAYFDAWRAVRAAATTSSPYWPFVDNWSSEAFGDWVEAVGGLVDQLAPTPALHRAFGRVVRFELRFWDAVTQAGADRWPD
jgi:thiaminase/transcriptional activator TenA